MAGAIGEPVEKVLPALAFPLARVPEGPETVQDLTPVALQEIVEVVPGRTRDGLALMVASGARTCTETDATGDVPPAPVHET